MHPRIRIDHTADAFVQKALHVLRNTIDQIEAEFLKCQQLFDDRVSSAAPFPRFVDGDRAEGNESRRNFA